MILDIFIGYFKSREVLNTLALSSIRHEPISGCCLSLLNQLFGSLQSLHTQFEVANAQNTNSAEFLDFTGVCDDPDDPITFPVKRYSSSPFWTPTLWNALWNLP
jgi:hypothetical protein